MGLLKTLFGSPTNEEAGPPADTQPRALPMRDPSPASEPERKVVEAEPPSRPLLTDHQPNFPQVLDRAGVTSDQRLRVQKAQELLKLLPSGANPTLKREIVEAAFAAFDISTEEIVVAASAHIAALNDYVAGGQAAKQRAFDEGDARIRELQRQIAEVRAMTDHAVAMEEAREVATRVEIARIEPVLAFFLHEQLVEPVIVERPRSGRRRAPEGFRSELPPMEPMDEPVLVDVEVDLEMMETRPDHVPDEEDEDVELELDLDPDPDTAPDEELAIDEILPPSVSDEAPIDPGAVTARFEAEARPVETETSEEDAEATVVEAEVVEAEVVEAEVVEAEVVEVERVVRGDAEEEERRPADEAQT